MLNKAYVEITNQCNLSCAFCPKTRRPPRRMSAAEFAAAAEALQGHVRFLYLHLMGEPLSHPELGEILNIAGQKGFRVCITTNGTLLEQRSAVLTAHAAVLHKLSVSLHALEGSGVGLSMDAYLKSVWSVCSLLRGQGVHCALRLWPDKKQPKPGRSFVSGCGTSWACFLTARWCPAAWITRGMCPWGISLKRP